ncbi:MAG: LPS export ABC transporter periplasmic protein LptC [Spirochaetaceae bacterium]|jgi:LPS export ABC transporter protein LptC|nr:LPS export ABC transporter periplasmic protein LptC [Spirochaetaceae bacterium]
MSNRRFFLTIACILPWLFSCEIHYNTFEDNSNQVPEFVLENAVITRWEKSVLRVSARAAQVEQYKRQNVYFARDVSCEIFDEEGALQTTGSFGYVSADTDTELYTLHGDIGVENRAEQTSVQAQALMWSGKTGLLSSSGGDRVTIRRTGETPFSFTGTGFAADTFNRTYRFTAVSGNIATGEEAAP